MTERSSTIDPNILLMAHNSVRLCNSEGCMGTGFIRDPVHGGKVTCHKCNGFICECEGYWNTFYEVWFHKNCYNAYEHYYGLDKPID